MATFMQKYQQSKRTEEIKFKEANTASRFKVVKDAIVFSLSIIVAVLVFVTALQSDINIGVANKYESIRFNEIIVSLVIGIVYFCAVYLILPNLRKVATNGNSLILIGSGIVFFPIVSLLCGGYGYGIAAFGFFLLGAGAIKNIQYKHFFESED